MGYYKPPQAIPLLEVMVPERESDDRLKAVEGDVAGNPRTGQSQAALKVRVRFPGGIFRDVECPPDMTMGDFCGELSEQFEMRGDFYVNVMLSGKRVAGTYHRKQEPAKDISMAKFIAVEGFEYLNLYYEICAV